MKTLRAIFAASLTLIVAAQAASAQEAKPVWVNAIDAAAKQFEQAYLRRDAKTISQEWSSDGTYITPNGAVYVGREAIQKLFESGFAKQTLPESIEVKITSMNSPAPDSVVERGRSIIKDSKGQTLSVAPYVAIHKKVGNTYPIEQLIEYPSIHGFHATPDLKWIVGKWASSNADRAVTLTNRLTADGKFIVSEFETKDGPPNGDLMITGVDPFDGRLSSWIFDTTGGVGHGEWKYDNGTWYLLSMRLEPGGERISLTHVLKPDGANSFDWKTTNRVVNGKPINDVQSTRVTRVGDK